MAEDRLKDYRAKRDFSRTSEPTGGAPSVGTRRYLIQKHAATRLHYDLRLEHDGVLKSWAVTRGPSLDPADKRLAVHVEDHPLDYGDFEGTIPKGEYGGGTVMLWDEGTWEPLGDPDSDLRDGKLKFVLNGARLHGAWMLVRIRNNRDPRSKADNWLLFKEKDGYAATERTPIVDRATISVRTGRTMEEIAAGHVEWTKAGRRIKEADAGAEPPDPGKPPGRRGKKQAAGEPPAFVKPQLATLVEAPPPGTDWLHEIKYDGYRAIAAVGGGRAVVYTRTGLDWTPRFAQLVQPLADLPCRTALLDGEIAVHDEEGRSDFGKLQDALATGKGALVYHLFDLLSLDGEDLTGRPLNDRKARLAKLLADSPPSGPLVYSDHVIGEGARVFAEACGMGLEGIVSKRADAPYRSDRGKSWLKTKCAQGQEFIIVGWEPSPVTGRAFAALLMAVREGERLSYRGKVGSGYSEGDLARIGEELKQRQIDKPAFDDLPAAARKKSRFVRPELVAEIAFRGWSSDGLIRQGSFKGLRLDKSAAEVVRETPVGEPEPAKKTARRHTVLATVDDHKDGDWIEIGGVRLTHPDRVMFPGSGITKRRLAEYYLAVAAPILRHVAGRPLSLVRCPRGQGGDCFFQKHVMPGFPEAFRPIEITDKSGTDTYLYIEDAAGLVASVQMSALELHVWGSHVATLEQPDRLVFDFDPDEDVGFSAVRDAAKEMRDRLKAIGLASFAMTTGGKGLHVVVPLTPRHGWDDIRIFAEALARTMAAETPDRYLAEMSKAKRKGRIFIDYLRNGRGATAIAPFSTRARAKATVAWPVSWPGLDRIESAQPASAETAADLLRQQRSDPWRGYFDVDQVLPLERLANGG